MAKKYETTIGLEVHAHLLTKSKAFCGCSTKFGSPPNTQTCPVCLGFPGVLPVLNREALNLSIKTALALGSRVAEHIKFDRKNYFYPDLPKNFQISQFDMPVASGGFVEIACGGSTKKIGLKRVHLEEDAAKLFHEEDSSLVDFNRAGTPLLEIVSEPAIASPDEAYSYLVNLKSILLYLGVSDCNMEEGSLRCDANVSVKPEGAGELGAKVELKNMNSFKGVKRALEYEVQRQRKSLEEGKKIIQETRLWDDSRLATDSMRTKEDSHDYRYFPEPDLLAFTIDKKLVEEIKRTLAELPEERRRRFISDYKLSEYDASLVTGQKEIADYFENCVKFYDKPKALVNWIMQDLSAEANKLKLTVPGLGVSPRDLAGLLKLQDNGAISGKLAKEILPEMIKTGKPAEDIIEEKNLVQISDKTELETIINKVIRSNSKSVEDYKKGKANAIIFLVGQVMKETKGKANPELANELLKKKLSMEAR